MPVIVSFCCASPMTSPVMNTRLTAHASSSFLRAVRFSLRADQDAAYASSLFPPWQCPADRHSLSRTGPSPAAGTESSSSSSLQQRDPASCSAALRDVLPGRER